MLDAMNERATARLGRPRHSKARACPLLSPCVRLHRRGSSAETTSCGLHGNISRMTDAGRESFRTLLGHAEGDLWTGFERARELHQTGDIGSAREGALGQFLTAQLPARFSVADGEIIDAHGNRTGQTDLFIFDGSATRPLQVFPNGTVLLPAEAVLATVEVKSTLTEPEVDKAIRGVHRVHRLRPWGDAWLPPRQGEPADDRRARVFTSVFAYRSSLTAEPWAERELKRFRARAAACGSPVESVDRLVVLDRGMILPALGRVAEPGEERGVLGLWFFSLINFLAREVQRRKPFPWDRYEARAPDVWKQVAAPQHDASRPSPAPAKPARKRRGKPSSAKPRTQSRRKTSGGGKPRGSRPPSSGRRRKQAGD